MPTTTRRNARNTRTNASQPNAGSAKAIAPAFGGVGDGISLKDELPTRCAEPGYRRVERKKKETTMQNRFRASMMAIVAVAAALGVVISAPIAWAQAQSLRLRRRARR
jgi:hypothetical protein